MQAKQPRAPRRTIEEWRPAPLLCKRFNVPDPYRGKGPGITKAPLSRVDALSLPETAAAQSAPAIAPKPPAVAPQVPSQAAPIVFYFRFFEERKQTMRTIGQAEIEAIDWF